jgi:hypothetical protein
MMKDKKNVIKYYPIINKIRPDKFIKYLINKDQNKK